MVRTSERAGETGHQPSEGIMFSQEINTKTESAAHKSNRFTGAKLLPTMGLAVLVLGACSGPARPELTQEPIIVRSTVQTEIVEVKAPALPMQSFRAISMVESLPVFSQPDSDEPLLHLEQTTEFGSARVLLVEQLASDWVEVRLPQRPNESFGWVRASDVEVERLDVIVQVDLEQRKLTIVDHGVQTTMQTVAVGSQDNPTPTGTFFITDKIDTPNDEGVYGPFAIGLSAYSETLTEFAGGNGQIGIHGTNDPTSIGQAVSHGCIRLPNEIITMLANDLPLGTMVVIL